MKLTRIALAGAVLLAAATTSYVGAQTAVSRVTFTPTGVIDMLPTSMSDDGSTIVGIGPYGAPNLLYTEAAGVSVIGDGCSSGQPAISGDGSTILGCNVDVNGSWNTAKWLGGTSWQDLGSEAGAQPCDVFLSGPWGVTQDGSLATGLLWLAQICKASAGTWDLVAGGPATKLPLIVAGQASRGNAINADGSVIVGWQDFAGRQAAKWVNGVGQFITGNGVDFLGEAFAVSASGNAIVGYGYNFGREGWLWRAGEGLRPIANKADGDFLAVDVSDSGRTVVGIVRDPSNGFSKGFIWAEGKGLSLLEDFLHNRHVDVPAGWTLNTASLISPDGKLIYGWGINPSGLIEMFKIDMAAPAPAWTVQPTK